MHTFDFLFGVFLGELILRHSNTLSKTLQQKTLSAAEGQQIARLTVEVLQSLRDSERVSAFYSHVVQEQICFGVSDPSLPRKHRAPQCFEDGSSASYFHPTAEDHYRQIYFEAVDHVIQAIRNRLDQPGYGITRTGKHPSWILPWESPMMMSYVLSANFTRKTFQRVNLKHSYLF